jgi:adenylate cyclase class 1
LNNDEANLIGSISIIYRNLWNEIRTQHFEGSTALLKALKLISNKICRNAAPPRVVNVHCYSANLRSELRDLIAGLVNKCINVQTSTIFQKQQLSEYKLHTHQRSGFFQALLENDDEIAKSAIHTTFPREIDEFASEGFLQFFFEDNADESFNVYILDEQNHIETYHNCHGSKEEKVKQIYKSHAIKLHKQDSNRESFNFPQFYQLLKLAEKIEIVPFQSKQHREYSQSSVNCK